MQTPKKKVHFFFFSGCCIVFDCSWQLMMFDKKQKSCVKRIHLVTDAGLYDRKAFYKVKIFFILRANSYVCWSYRGKTGSGFFCPTSWIELMHNVPKLKIWNTLKMLQQILRKYCKYSLCIKGTSADVESMPIFSPIGHTLTELFGKAFFHVNIRDKTKCLSLCFYFMIISLLLSFRVYIYMQQVSSI